jgi:hypothetical protein
MIWMTVGGMGVSWESQVDLRAVDSAVCVALVEVLEPAMSIWRKLSSKARQLEAQHV